MKYFLDLEFMENGQTIEPLSIALVAEDGREFYAINRTADRSRANIWVKQNVIPRVDDLSHLKVPSHLFSGPHHLIGAEVREFVSLGTGKPEFWGYYADYDWVAFCQLFGTMMDLPKGFPMYCRDIKQMCDMLGNPPLPPQGKDEHHALLDARWNKLAYEFLLREVGRQIHSAVERGMTHQLFGDVFHR